MPWQTHVSCLQKKSRGSGRRGAFSLPLSLSLILFYPSSDESTNAFQFAFQTVFSYPLFFSRLFFFIFLQRPFTAPPKLERALGKLEFFFFSRLFFFFLISASIYHAARGENKRNTERKGNGTRKRMKRALHGK